MTTDLKAIAPLILTKIEEVEAKPSKRKSKKMKSNTYEELILELARQVRYNKIDEDWSDFY